MVDASPDPRKYIIGWLTCRPGQRDALMRLAVPYALDCRKEAGCVFFEMNPSVHDPDVVTVAECFASPEAHEVHLQTTWFQTLWAELSKLCVEGRFENIFPDHVIADRADFAAN